MGVSLGELAGRYGCELSGDPETIVDHVATLAGAGERAISFLANRSYRSQMESTGATAVILAPDDLEACPVAALVTPNPYAVYAHVAQELHPPFDVEPGVDTAATVDADCRLSSTCHIAAGAIVEQGAVIGERVVIGPNTVVGRDVRIDDDSRLMANVTVYHGVKIGKRCLIHSGVILGADGFGLAPGPAGWTKVPQVGAVTLGDDVEIGANTTVDRGAIEDTVIGTGVKLDNQIQVAHNVRIGDHTAIAALVGISGSTTIGGGCMIGGASLIAGHISICDQVMLAAGTGVAQSIEKPGAYGGFPANAEEIGRWRKNVIRFSQLDEMSKRLRRMEKQLKQMSDD